jgi:hypothetical protein
MLAISGRSQRRVPALLLGCITPGAAIPGRPDMCCRSEQDENHRTVRLLPLTRSTSQRLTSQRLTRCDSTVQRTEHCTGLATSFVRMILGYAASNGDTIS